METCKKCGCELQIDMVLDGRDHYCWDCWEKVKSKRAPRYRLSDIIVHLRRGDIARIARASHSSSAAVSAILNGKRSQVTPRAKHIIRCAEHQAECNQRKW